MIYSLEGRVIKKEEQFIVLEVCGIGFKLFMEKGAIRKVPKADEKITLFCALRFKDDNPELFGFLAEPSLKLFELLTKVNGVGPRTALTVLGVDSVERITAAILEKRSDLILKASGIGKKTAERIILELHNKLELSHATSITENMTAEAEIEEALISLGYSRNESREAAQKSSGEGIFENQLKEALKFIGQKRNYYEN